MKNSYTSNEKNSYTFPEKLTIFANASSHTCLAWILNTSTILSCVSKT